MPPQRSKSGAWLFLPCSSSLTSSCPASFGAALVAIHLVAVRARRIQFVADVDERFEVPGLRRAMRELAGLREIRDVLFPVRPFYGDRPAVLAAASWRRQKSRGLGDRHCGLIDSQPARID